MNTTLAVVVTSWLEENMGIRAAILTADSDAAMSYIGIGISGGISKFRKTYCLYSNDLMIKWPIALNL